MSLTKHQKAILSTLTTGSHKIAYDKQYDCWELKTISTRFGYDRFLLKSTVHRLQDAGAIRFEFANHKYMYFVKDETFNADRHR